MHPGSAEGLPAPHRASISRTTYRFGTTSIEVACDDPDVARWLTEFISPWFSTEMPNRSALRVKMTSSLKQFLALACRETESDLQPLPCFGLDSMLVSCPGWIESDGTILAADKEFGCYYRLQGSQVEVISRPQDRPARIGLMRVVRELALLRASSQTETLDLHAAAFVFRGRAILLAGDKNAGKTTLLAHALTSHRTSLLANDRVIVDRGRLQAHGVPTVVSVRKETEQMFSSLAHLLPRRAVLLHEGELASADFAGTEADDRFVLSLGQFARQLGSRVQPLAPVGAILFPEISPSLSAWSLERLDPSEAAARFRRSLYGCRLGSRSETIFQKITKALPDANVQGSLEDCLTAAVPVMRCRLGKNAYCESSDNWLKALPIKEETAPL